MIFLMILLCTYILAVNFYGFRLLRSQKNACVSGEIAEGKGDGKLLLAGALGGALAVYITMFILKYRLDSCILMLALPLLAVVNIYCFYLGFRGILFFW